MTNKETFKINPDTVEGNTLAEKGANMAIDPCIKAAITTHLFTKNLSEIDTDFLRNAMRDLIESICTDDLSCIERILVAQALTLDSIFHRLVGQSQENIGHYPNAVDTYMRLGLKAQAQCRTTIESLVALKRPRQFINQTNVANLMQVNNSHERLEANNGEGMDFRAQAKTVRENQRLATLEAVDGSKNARRQND